MGVISVPNTFAPNTAISSSAVNSNFATIYNEFNGAVGESNLADSAVTTAKIDDDAVTTAKIVNGAVTPDKLLLGASTATVATAESRTNTAYGDLATPGPAVTVTVPASGKVFVSVSAGCSVGTSGNTSRCTYAMSGANTQSASDSVLPSARTSATTTSTTGGVHLLTGLTAGSTTFTLKYRSGPAGSATWDVRQITVVPIA